jgi:hypothetical protein
MAKTTISFLDQNEKKKLLQISFNTEFYFYSAIHLILGSSIKTI